MINHTENQQADVTFFNTGTEERTGEVKLEAGKEYQMELRFSNFKQISAMSPYVSPRIPKRGWLADERPAAEEHSVSEDI